MNEADPSPVLEAAQAWKERCLIRGGSIFSDRPLWTAQPVAELKKHFVDAPDESDEDYGSKLKKQLGNTSPAARQLFAEMQWVLYLFARDILKPDTKREDTIRVWFWSGEQLQGDNQFLGKCLEPGIGNPGTTFNTLRWLEMQFLVRFALRWAELPEAQRRTLLSTTDPFQFGHWLDQTDEAQRRCARNIVCFLLFPDDYERISSGTRKRQIFKDVVATIEDEPNLPRPGPRAALIDVDRALLSLRRVLEHKFQSTELDYFRPPIRSLWDPANSASPGDDAPPESKPIAGAYGVQRVGTAYSVEQLAEDAWTDPARIHEWLALLKRKKQLVFQGPPGTGKTLMAKGLAHVLRGGTLGLLDLVQFHPSYAYEDFIGGIRPDLQVGDRLAFKREEGRFSEFCRKAAATDGAPCVMIIDEINRANLSKVFGELLYLLEYRDERVRLPSGELFKIPPNVYLIGTMNTSDRSIALVDHALRRRFCFVHLHPDFDALGRYLSRHQLPAESLIHVLKQVNQVINDEGCSLGISFFMRDGAKLRDTLPTVWTAEVQPFLEEIFFNQAALRDRFRWSDLVKGELKEWG